MAHSKSCVHDVGHASASIWSTPPLQETFGWYGKQFLAWVADVHALSSAMPVAFIHALLLQTASVRVPWHDDGVAHIAGEPYP